MRMPCVGSGEDNPDAVCGALRCGFSVREQSKDQNGFQLSLE